MDRKKLNKIVQLAGFKDVDDFVAHLNDETRTKDIFALVITGLVSVYLSLPQEVVQEDGLVFLSVLQAVAGIVGKDSTLIKDLSEEELFKYFRKAVENTEVSKEFLAKLNVGILGFFSVLEERLKEYEESQKYTDSVITLGGLN